MLPNLNNKENKDKKESTGLPKVGLPAIGLPEPASVKEVEPIVVPSEETIEVEQVEEKLELKITPIREEPVMEEFIEPEPIAEPKVKKKRNRKVNEDKPYDEDKFIDKKKKKIIPMGGNKSETVRANNFDDRKNKMRATNIIKIILVIFTLILFALGIKNTFAPANNYSRGEIEAFARNGAGITTFPKEKGQSFAESFIEDLLTIDSKDPARLEVMSYYYASSSYSTSSIIAGAEAKQNVIVKPRTYEYRPVNDSSSMYKISTFVSDSKGNTSVDNRSSGRWLSFAVNVYYDNKSGEMAIEPSSPILVPSVPLTAPNNVPKSAILGNGQVLPDMEAILAPTINGYVQAYANSSISSHEAILQYIPNNPIAELYTGFGGSVKLDGDVNSAILKVVYGGNTDGEYKVDTTVKWVDTTTTDKNVIKYSARYITTITKTSDNRYVVQSFRPFVYEKGLE